MRVDSIQFLRDIQNSKAEPSDFLSEARPEYKGIGHSSVNKAATTFGSVSPEVRDIHEQAEQNVPSDLEFAPAADGSGDKAQEEGSIPTMESSGSVGPLTPADWEKYKNRLGQRESGNDWNKVNTIGFVGRWQFGAPALQDLGYVRGGASTRALVADSSWTGKDGVSSRQAFLSNTQVQEQCLLSYTRANYKTLLRMKVISRSDSVATVAGFLATAHLKGPGGAQKLKNGQDNADAYGTNASEYYRMMSSEMGGTNTDPLTAAYGGKMPSDSAAESYVNAYVQPDAANFSMPGNGAAPQYPFNKVMETEGGHVKEYDDTPGHERISERHKTGSGYDYMSDGGKREIVVGSRYTAVMGSDHILINGVCQIIVNGDCGLRVNGTLNHSVGNDYNLNVGGNMVVTVGGDKYEKVSGSSNEQVIGDAALNVSGFYNVGVDGDYSLQSASVSMISRDGDVSLGAAENMSLVAFKDMKMNTPAMITFSAGKDVQAFAKGNVGFYGQKSAFLSAVSGPATVHGSSKATVHSGGPVQLDGSIVNATPYVDRAEWANRGGVVRLAKAVGGSPGSAPSSQGSDGDGGSSGKLNEGTKNTEEKKVTKAIEQFNAIDPTKTQSYGGGEGELRGYRDGFKYE